jgi:hypothetical protein
MKLGYRNGAFRVQRCRDILVSRARSETNVGSFRDPALLSLSTPSKIALTGSRGRASYPKGEGMERIIERRAGLDVRTKTAAVCVRVPSADGTREQHVRTFGTTAVDLLAVREWVQCIR